MQNGISALYRLLAGAMLAATTAAVYAGPQPAGTGTTPLDTVYAEFGDDLLFHAGFDGQPQPDSATGAATAEADETVDYGAGHHGKALAQGTVVFAGAGNFNTDAGSLAVLVRIDRPAECAGDEGYFAPLRIQTAGGGLLSVGKMNTENLALAFCHQRPSLKDKQSAVTITGPSTRSWTENRWHLLVVTWKPGLLTFSVDGAAPKALTSTPGLHGEPKSMIATANSRCEKGFLLTLDELIIFANPLTTAQIARLAELLR